MTSLGSVCREKIEAVAAELNVDCEIVRVRNPESSLIFPEAKIGQMKAFKNFMRKLEIDFTYYIMYDHVGKCSLALSAVYI